MTILFEDADLYAAYKQKKRILHVYWAVLIAFVAICVASIVFYVSLPYEDPLQPIPQAVTCVASCLFIIFSYVFLGIKFHRSRRYYKLISSFSGGMKQINRSIFLRYEGTELKDGVDYYVLIFSEWSKKKSEYMDRKIYSVVEKACPQFEAGDIVSYITHGNVIVGHSVIGHDDAFIEEKQREDAARQPIRIGDFK